MSTGPTLAIQLLGGFTIAVGGRSVSTRAWGARNAYQIVKLLALAPDQRLTVEQLLDALWPEDDPVAARRACYQAIYLARNALDPDRLGLLVVQHGMVSLQSPGGVQTDLALFFAAIQQARRTRQIADFTAARALYQGALLPDDHYADWAALPRDEAERAYQHLLTECAQQYAALGQPDQARQVWQQLLVSEPANEAAHVALMRLAAQGGQRAQALSQFRQLRAALRRDLDASPSPDSERLYATLLAGQPLMEDGPAPIAPAARSPKQRVVPSLPAPLTALYGRDEDCAAVREALRSARLVMLTGSGGVGKTRLALAVAHTLAVTTPGGVWWVDLAALADEGLVIGTVAQALGVHEQPGTPLLATLIATLREGDALLVLDNCEHLVDACAALAQALLTGCAAVRVLATSRVALRVAGELVWRVPSLPIPAAVPPEPTADQLAALAANPALHVFLARARLSRPGFQLTAREAAALARICRALDGVPLALELAAARVAVLTTTQLAERLGQALRILTDGPRSAPARQRTLRATLDWSYQLLDGAAQLLLAELSVFAGGWTLTAAEVVGGAGEETLPVLAGLVEQSLVQVAVPTEVAGEVRYHLLETVRQFAAEQLAAIDATDTIRERHARYVLSLAEEAAPHLNGQQRVVWLARLEGELDNLRAALTWWAASSAATQGLALATNLGHFWLIADHLREGLTWLTTAFAASATTAPPLIQGRALRFAGTIAANLGKPADARAYLTEGIARLRRCDAPLDLAEALNALYVAEYFLGNRARAREHLVEARDLYVVADSREGEIRALHNLGALAFAEGDLVAALDDIGAALAHSREAHLTRLLPTILINAGHLRIALGQTAGGVAALREAIVLTQEHADWLNLQIAMVIVGWLHSRQGLPTEAARYLGAAAAIRARLGQTKRVEIEQRFHDPAEAAARAALGDAGYAAAFAIGEGWAITEAASQALAALATFQEECPTPRIP